MVKIHKNQRFSVPKKIKTFKTAVKMAFYCLLVIDPSDPRLYGYIKDSCTHRAAAILERVSVREGRHAYEMK
jgi:hypothetical protein